MSILVSDAPSPNFNERPSGAAIDILLLHYTGMMSAEDALDRLTDPDAKVSAHYLVDEDGATFAMVAEKDRAWHAGVSYWAEETDVNARSIGIEIVNPGHDLGYRDFPEAQMAAVIALCREILSRHAIPAHRVLGHSDVAPTRKQDPGERFDWPRLAAAGIGLYPPDNLTALGPPDAGAFRDELARFGYGFSDDPKGDAALTAFRRHFRPDHLCGPVDGTDAARLDWLLGAAADS